MATTREMHAEVMRILECMNTKIDGVAHLSKENRSELQRLRPQKLVHPIPRPKQGTQMVRGTSVTRYVRQYTVEKNQSATEGETLYDIFKEDIDDKQYNTDALNCLEWILGLHLGSELGKLTWEQVCKQTPENMGLIIRDAVNAPELKVFSQAAGQWAIQMLITNKMNSRIRYNKDHRGEEMKMQEAAALAPMIVPDLEHRATNLVYDAGGSEQQLEEWDADDEVEEESLTNRNTSAPLRNSGVFQSRVAGLVRGRGRRATVQPGASVRNSYESLPPTHAGSSSVVGSNQGVPITRSAQNLRSVASRGRGISRSSRGRGRPSRMRTRVVRGRTTRR